MTAAFTLGQGQAAVFIAVDHCLAECVGVHAALRGTRHVEPEVRLRRNEAPEPTRQGAMERFGGVEKHAAVGLTIRHDRRSQYMSRDFQKEIARLGAFEPTLGPMAVRPSPSPAFGRAPEGKGRAPEGKGRAERFVRTLKENLLRVRTFRAVEDLRLALVAFRQTHTGNWRIERHGCRSPARYRRDQMNKPPLAP